MKFRVLLLIICALSLTTAFKSELNTRIIGGNVVDISKHPYLVSIRYKSDNEYWHKCAGVIYSESVVITCAQCITMIKEGERILVVAGANTRTGADGWLYHVKKTIAHPDYDARIVDYDIGILILEEPFNFNDIPINTISISEKRPYVNKIGTVAGWGYREEFGPNSYLLEDVDVPIVSTNDCIKIYGEKDVTDRMICAGYLKMGGKDACQGDTGGPLVVDNKLVGLVSWGRGCARPNFPTVYTYVTTLKKWIDETIAENVLV